MKALIFQEGQIMVSPMLDRHLSDISNMSMRKPFADKYPEFSDVCRFDEVQRLDIRLRIAQFCM